MVMADIDSDDTQALQALVARMNGKMLTLREEIADLALQMEERQSRLQRLQVAVEEVIA